METSGLQVGKTRYTHYSIAYHLVWMPQYRRKILTREVQAETKRLLTECCERHGLTLLALETDIDHIHVFVSAPPQFSPAMTANLLKGAFIAVLAREIPTSQKGMWKGSCMDIELLRWHSRCGVSRNDHTVYHAMSGQVVRYGQGRFHPALFQGRDFPLSSLRM